MTLFKRKYPINERVFDNITPESAYWIGFLYADGACANENKIRLWQQIKDLDVLRKFKNFLQTGSRPIKRKEQDGFVYAGLEVRSWRLHNKLKPYEVTFNKHLRHRVHVDLLQKDVRRHFIRGIFDGDGCFYVDKRGYLFAEITGYKPLLRDIKNCLVSDGIIKDTKNLVKNGKTIFRIRFSAREALLLGDYIYKGAVSFMDRKYYLYKHHVERLNTSSVLYVSDSLKT